MKVRLAFLAFLLATAAQAQTRQPAQITTLPTTSPQEFDLLDKTGKWLPLNTGAGTDVRMAGCVADGVTDQTACINNALANASDCVVIPATPLGFYVAGTLTVTRCMRGTVFNPNVSTASFANASFIKCNNQVAQPCVTVNNAGANAAWIANLSVIGAGGTPVAGSTGVQWQGGYNLILDNLQSANFGSCAYIGPTTGSAPLSIKGTNTFFSRCSKHYVVNDGTPELYFIGGRWGENGGGDYNSADDFVFNTRTAVGGNGAGPNGLVIDSVQINPGGVTVGCAFRWGNFISSPGGLSANKIINSHIEVMHGDLYTGSATRGMVCIDSTVPHFPGLLITSSDLLEDGASRFMPLFNIDNAVPFDDEFKITNSFLCAGASTLTVNNVGGNHVPLLANDYICGPQTYAGGAGSAQLTLSNNNGGFTIQNRWSRLSLNNITGTITDNATGAVWETNDPFRTWTPTLTFGGNSVGVAYATQIGSITRTSTGGYIGYFAVTLTAKGTSTGAAAVANIPYNCLANYGQEALAGVTSLSGLTAGLIHAQTAAASTYAFLSQSNTAGGMQALTDANFTNTSSIQGRVTCGSTQ